MKIGLVSEIVNTRFHINKIKVVTKAIDLLLVGTYPKLSLLEKYVMMGRSEIGLSSKDFGFSALRKSLNDGDVEAVETDFAFVVHNATTYFGVLETKGFTAAALTELKDLAGLITSENDLQEALKSDKRQAVLANGALFEEVGRLIKDLQDTGKRLFKYTNKELTKDFTMRYILSQIRHEGKKKEDE